MKRVICAALLLCASGASAQSLTGLYATGRLGTSVDFAGGTSFEAGGPAPTGHFSQEGAALVPGTCALALGWGLSGLNAELDLNQLCAGGPALAPMIATLELGLRLRLKLAGVEPWLRLGGGYSFVFDRSAGGFGAAHPVGLAGSAAGGLYYWFSDWVAAGPELLGALQYQAPGGLVFNGNLSLDVVAAF